MLFAATSPIGFIFHHGRRQGQTLLRAESLEIEGPVPRRAQTHPRLGLTGEEPSQRADAEVRKPRHGIRFPVRVFGADDGVVVLGQWLPSGQRRVLEVGRVDLRGEVVQQIQTAVHPPLLVGISVDIC